MHDRHGMGGSGMMGAAKNGKKKNVFDFLYVPQLLYHAPPFSGMNRFYFGSRSFFCATEPNVRGIFGINKSVGSEPVCRS